MADENGMNEPTEKHKEEARELPRSELIERLEDALHVARDDGMARLSADTLAAALTTLSSRDTEIREVLEGLRSSHREPCWCALSHLTETTQFEEDGTHDKGCLAARGLWERVKG